MASRIYTGCLIASTDKASEKGLWFVFHAEGNDVLGLNLIEPHAKISYEGFADVLKSPDRKEEKDKIVLKGGSHQSDDALSILHETIEGGADSVRINEGFSIRTYRYVLIPGKPPAVIGRISQTDKIAFSAPADFLIIMGYKIWEMEKLLKGIDGGQYRVVPATKEIVFGTTAKDRLTKASRLVH